MSMEYCYTCDTTIDTDFNLEHFEECVHERVEDILYKNKDENNKGYQELIELSEDLASRGYSELSDYVDTIANRALKGLLTGSQDY